MMVVAIHQPNFFPWLGYFDKIAKSDVFLFLDDVQYRKTGGEWCNRVKLLISAEARWVTAAIDRAYHGTRQIREMHFLASNPWREKMLTSLQVNYSRHPFYLETISVIEPLILNSESNVAEFNVQAVMHIANHLGFDTGKLKRSSSVLAEGRSNDLLIALTRQFGGDTYLCGGGAGSYQDDGLFARSGLRLQYQNFQHPAYQQRGQAGFVAGLSIIDAAMNLGWDGVRDLMQWPRRPDVAVTGVSA